MATGASLLLSSLLARKSAAEQESTMGGKTSAEWVKIAVGILFCTCLAPVRPSSIAWRSPAENGRGRRLTNIGARR